MQIMTLRVCVQGTPLSICSHTVSSMCAPWSSQKGVPRFQCSPMKDTWRGADVRGGVGGSGVGRGEGGVRGGGAPAERWHRGVWRGRRRRARHAPSRG